MALDLYVAPGKMRDTRGAKFYVAHVFSHRRGEEVLESTLAFYSFLTLTNLDREHEWARYLAMPAGSQNEGQSPLAQGHERGSQSFPLLDGPALREMGASTRVVLSCIH